MSGPKKLVQNISYTRNPVYVFYAAGSVLLFLICSLLASRSSVGVIETSVFNLFYNLPSWLMPIFEFILLLSSMVVALIISTVLFFRRRRDIALRLIVAALVAYLLSTLFQMVLSRAQPSSLITGVQTRLNIPSLGYPSSYMAVATAVGLTLALYVARSQRKWLLYGILFIGVAELYLGLNLPLDVIGGYAVGVFSFSLVSLGFGSIYYPINRKRLVKKLSTSGMKGLKLKPASVDARGSTPFFGSYDGGPVFVKVYNRDNNLADWLFKLTRRVRYRRLEDEVPSLTPKRAIEHEAYITMLAKNSGVSVPQIIGIYKIAQNTYAMATRRIDGKGLDSLDKKLVTDKMLGRIWQQITKLHSSNIIHKDLRTANIMIEKSTGKPWIIDFGFSESAIDKKAYYKDNVEFIASSATIIGAKRAVKAAKSAIGPNAIKEAIAYMQYPALSGATTYSLKRHKGLLEEIIAQMYLYSGDESESIKAARINRIARPYHKVKSA